jgi:CRISPR-associated protein (TIGR02584 family)
MKKILLLVTGMSPQIVTETLYGLAVKPTDGQNKWTPDEIHVISTTGGLTQIRASLFKDGHFDRLLDEYQLPTILFDESCLHAIYNENGTALADLKTPQDNEYAANAICEQVRLFTQDDDTEVHVSIAGGRKTMGFYAGYALSLYGRVQDRMSHVLVSSEFESSREFFYPAPTPQTTFITPNGKTERLDAYDAQVWLAQIPFVRLRASLNKHALVDKACFSDVIASINVANQPLHIKLNTAEGKTLWVNDTPVVLSPREFAFYAAFMADRLQNDNGIKRPTKGMYSDDHALFHQFYSSEQVMFDAAFFDERRSDIKKTLTDALGLDVANRLIPEQEGRNKPYRLLLNASQITLINQ